MESAPNKLYEIKKLDYFETINYEFSRNFVEYIKNYNQLDQNIGITIAWLVSCNNPRLAYPMIKKLNTHDKMCVLKEVVKNKFNETNQEIVKAYCEWIEKASTTRTERNQFIHGYWHLSGSVTEKPIFFSPISWDIEARADKNQNFSLDEFRVIVDELKAVCTEFGNLRKRYIIC
ncbi:MAG: hypothetical protein KKA54_16900 [Proteobacteria bacterium]|nr:hypothetical protein [Pseudomonadota bacterium]MBU0968045.1 hypothetical protein [Pseudomonadota bacterium]